MDIYSLVLRFENHISGHTMSRYKQTTKAYMVCEKLKHIKKGKH